jgi:hypothetical protein
MPLTLPEPDAQTAIIGDIQVQSDGDHVGPLGRAAKRFSLLHQIGFWRQIDDRHLASVADADELIQFERDQIILAAEKYCPPERRTPWRVIHQRGGQTGDPLDRGTRIGVKGWCVGPLAWAERRDDATTRQLDAADRRL